jgi:hypothetical protein
MFEVENRVDGKQRNKSGFEALCDMTAYAFHDQVESIEARSELDDWRSLIPSRSREIMAP